MAVRPLSRAKDVEAPLQGMATAALAAAAFSRERRQTVELTSSGCTQLGQAGQQGQKFR